MINYYLLTKPGIIMGNLVTLAAGFLLASKGHVDLLLLLATVFGLGFIMASACVFNNYIDRHVDKKMKRTQNRALSLGLIKGRNAIAFATILGLIGSLILFFFTNILTLYVAAFGFVVYVFIYSLWKSHTIYGTAIGSIAGAVPPVVGYCAVSNHLDAGALILFIMLVLWQMPHFFAIAIWHYDDYVRADIPVLPVLKGAQRTKIHMFFYIIGFILSASLLTYFEYVGYLYLFVTLAFGVAWLWLAWKGFGDNNDRLWGKEMFRLSLVVIAVVSLMIPFG